MSRCIPLDELIVRDWVVDSIRSHVLKIVDCIINCGCKFWQDDDASAAEIAECIVSSVDINEWTEDEFEYAVRAVNYFSTLKFLFVNGVLQENIDGDIHIPEIWQTEIGYNNDSQECGGT